MSSIASLDTPDFSLAAQELTEAGRIIGHRGWVPATSGNLSKRLDDRLIAITRSGTDKANLLHHHIMAVALHEPPPRQASAETALHLAAYRRNRDIGAVLHVHSLNATLLSRRFAKQGYVRLSGFELLKAFAGITTHDISVEIPIFPNSQDVAALAKLVEDALVPAPSLPGYLLAGHGLYTWGRDVDEAMRHLEAFDFLFSCVLAEEQKQ